MGLPDFYRKDAIGYELVESRSKATGKRVRCSLHPRQIDTAPAKHVVATPQHCQCDWLRQGSEWLSAVQDSQRRHC